MNTFKIWDEGIALADADYEFAPDSLCEQYDEPKVIVPRTVVPPMKRFLARIEDEGGRESLLTATRQVATIVDTLFARDDALKAMREGLLGWLREGRLVAYGFAIPRNTTANPEPIPVDLFHERHVNWKESSIKGAGLAFVSVRVLHPDWLNELKAAFPDELSIAGKTAKLGRPTSREAITAATQSLIDDGTLPNDNLQKQNIELVRKQVHKMFPGQFPDDHGLKNEAIRKIFVSQLAQLKARNSRDHKL